MKYENTIRTSKVGERGQVTIPKKLRDRYGVRPGQELVFEEHPEGLIIKKVAGRDPLRALREVVKDRIDVDDYLAEARGEAWSTDLDS